MLFVLFSFHESLSLFIRNIISLHPSPFAFLNFLLQLLSFLFFPVLRSYFIRTVQRIQYNKVDVRYYHVGIHNSFELQKISYVQDHI